MKKSKFYNIKIKVVKNQIENKKPELSNQHRKWILIIIEGV